MPRLRRGVPAFPLARRAGLSVGSTSLMFSACAPSAPVQVCTSSARVVLRVCPLALVAARPVAWQLPGP
eukprot:11172220-Lingulodinium_polyedra.AAC.1